MKTIETQRFTHGEVDEVAFARFVEKSKRDNRKLRDRAEKRGTRTSVWFGMTDADCDLAAEQYCSVYRHQFRVLVPVDGGAR